MVMPRTHGDQRKRSVSAYLGPETFSNVYVAELRGLVLANKTRIVLMAEAKRTGRMPVFSDSPATVRAMHAPRMSSDQPTQVALLGQDQPVLYIFRADQDSPLGFYLLTSLATPGR
ncbi:hypothetical protein CBS147321_11201 [Aspergillus niger]|nr:hypothetical protein CBS11350_9168 [Aspergillus niger]KAI2927458.1 hypothetical protein CBS147321_11201 [Aspergillus niger]KAI2955916.1 hypothetical protein CBS147324_10987 [Aspergillus niger]KAI2985116.1 hypothetical protein CBS147345_11056 [Aspergillus niger]